MRPRCEKCGKRIQRIHRRLIHFYPDYCPSCGTKIGLKQKSDLRYYETIVCIVVFTIFAIVMMTFTQLGLI
jgi:uncharacterized protein (DUF983 family)